MIDETVAKDLGLKLYEGHLNDVNGGAYTSRPTIVPDLSVGPLEMHDVVMATIPPLTWAHDSDHKVVGLLGFDFIGALVLRIGYEKGTLAAFDPDRFAIPANELGAMIPVRLGENIPMTEVSVNGYTSQYFGIDTGAGGNVLIEPSFLERYPNALTHGDDMTPNFYIRGVGGAIAARYVRLGSVEVGGAVTFKEFGGYRIDQLGVYPGIDGLIGAEFLRFFTVYLDFTDSRIILERNHIGT